MWYIENVLFWPTLYIAIFLLFCSLPSMFDIVGWVFGRASDLRKLSDEVLAWLSVCSKVQMICIYGPADATATPSSLDSLK